jgi:hypothetical protein
MDSELGIDNDKLALMNEENHTELDMMNGVNNVDLITRSVNLTDEVKIIFDNLVIEQFRHQDYQSNCFEELIKIWLGQNFLLPSLALDIKKETERFDNDCRDYILKTIAKYLPDGENDLYSAYYSLKNTGNYVVYTDGECTTFDKDKIDVRQFYEYIKSLHRKILRQYNNLKYNFGVYLTEKLEDAEFHKLNIDPVVDILRRRSQRITTKKVTDYKPFLQFNKIKNKKTIKDFLKTNTTSNKTSKKRKVNLLNDLYLQYLICVYLDYPDRFPVS